MLCRADYASAGAEIVGPRCSEVVVHFFRLGKVWAVLRATYWREVFPGATGTTPESIDLSPTSYT